MLNDKIWWPDENFYCAQCGKRCNGKTNSMVLQNDAYMVRWCDACGYLEQGRKDCLSYISRSVTELELLLSQNYEEIAFINPVIARGALK